jgi:Ca-activated chloride channel family protein
VNNKQNLIICIDASISMNDSFGKGTKIQAVCDGIEMMIPQLSQQRGTQIGIVGYNEKPFVVSPLTWPNSHNLINRAKRIRPGGCTNLLGGASLACDLLLRRPAHFSRRVILLTDGHHNTGSITPDQLIFKAKAYQVVLDTIGIGNEGAYNKKLLINLSSQTFGEFIAVKDLPRLLATFRKLSSPKNFKPTKNKSKVASFNLFRRRRF